MTHTDKLRRQILSLTPASAARHARKNGITPLKDGRLSAPAVLPAVSRLAAQWGARVRLDSKS